MSEENKDQTTKMEKTPVVEEDMAQKKQGESAKQSDNVKPMDNVASKGKKPGKGRKSTKGKQAGKEKPADDTISIEFSNLEVKSDADAHNLPGSSTAASANMDSNIVLGISRNYMYLPVCEGLGKAKLKVISSGKVNSGRPILRRRVARTTAQLLGAIAKPEESILATQGAMAACATPDSTPAANTVVEPKIKIKVQGCDLVGSIHTMIECTVRPDQQQQNEPAKEPLEDIPHDSIEIDPKDEVKLY